MKQYFSIALCVAAYLLIATGMGFVWWPLAPLTIGVLLWFELFIIGLRGK